MSVRMGGGFSRAIWLLLCMAQVAMVLLTGKYLRLAIACRKWPVTPGVIASATEKQEAVHQTPRQSAGPQKFNYRADIRYSYTVNGTDFSGDQISFGDVAGSS